MANPSLIDFPERLAAVAFTSGCNFSCGFCHNASLLADAHCGYTWDELGERCLQYRRDWVDGVVVSGGEPTLSAELPELLEFLRGFGFAIKLDSNGSCPDMLARCLPLVDYVAMDVKCALSSYPALTGFEDPERIAESVALLKAQARDYEFRTTVLGSFHTDDEMREIAALIQGARRYVLQAFVPRDGLLSATYRQEPRTPPGRLTSLAETMAGCAADILVRGA